jgi:hypothetical protein
VSIVLEMRHARTARLRPIDDLDKTEGAASYGKIRERPRRGSVARLSDCAGAKGKSCGAAPAAS